MTAFDLSVDGQIATMTLNNPPQNRLTDAVLQGFAASMAQLSNEPSVRAVALRSDGEDFSWGGDITPWLEMTPEEFGQRIEGGLALCNAFEDLQVPVVAAVQGMCGGGGFEIALRADIIVAAEDAVFRHSEATIGVFTFLGGVQRVADRVGRTRAIEWAMTAEDIPARAALDAGLINAVVPRSDLDAALEAWVERLANGATRSHAVHKHLLREWSVGGSRAADAQIPELATQIMKTEDARQSLAVAIEALRAGRPRPDYPFKGR